MTHLVEPDPDPDYIRTREAHSHLVYTLSTSLPPPPDASPEALHQRNQSAITQVAELCPVTAAEAALAAQYVAGAAHAMACLRLGSLPDTDPVMVLKCYAQAASLMRQSQAALRTLQRTQALRAKRDANPVTADAAAWAEHMAAAAMTDALTELKREPAQPQPEPDAPDVAPADVAPADVAPADVAPADVALYAAIFPERAALIRRHGGVPADITFGPPDEAIVRALIATRSPVVETLDHQVP